MPLNREQQVLVEENMGLVGTVIRDNVRDVNRIGLFTYQDIFQIGCLGLSKAAGKYRPGNNKFSTYAYIAIRNEIYNALDYATVRRGEIITDTETVLSLMPPRDEVYNTSSDLGDILDRARSKATGVTAKGIDALRLLANGYTCREIGELMGGASANNVAAWISKARAFLKSDPAILAFREAI